MGRNKSNMLDYPLRVGSHKTIDLGERDIVRSTYHHTALAVDVDP